MRGATREENNGQPGRNEAAGGSFPVAGPSTLLRQAAERGLLNSSDPLKAEELVPLRSRPDFSELFKELLEWQHPSVDEPNLPGLPDRL